MVCLQLCMDHHDEIQPICAYLKTRGWGDTVELLSAYKCEEDALPMDFAAFEGGDSDPYKVVMRSSKHPTELFKSIQQRDWGAALHSLHKNPSDAKTWIYRETEFPQNELKWKLLPIHAAVALGGPAYLIIELIQAYPECAKKWDSKRSLPIHVAASRIDIDSDGERVLNHLLKLFPESAGVENGKGRTPIQLAYAAQVRKDRRAKRQMKLSVTDGRDAEEEGFELQLEMREEDSIENCKTDRDEIPNWSLIDASVSRSSSYATKDMSSANDSRLEEPPVNSSITKEIEDVKKPLADDLSAISSAVALAISRDMLHQSPGSSSSRTNISPDQGSTNSNPINRKSVESGTNMPNKQKTALWTNTLSQNNSYDLPPRPTMSASPITLPSPLMLMQSPSRSNEKNSRIDRYSLGWKSYDDCSKSTTSQTSKQNRICKQAHSCDNLPPRPVMYSSPLKSLPSPMRAFKQRSRILQTSVSLDCKSSENVNIVNTGVSDNTNVSAPKNKCSNMDRCSMVEEMYVDCAKKDPDDFATESTQTSKQNRNDDLPTRPAMYSSPLKSLPSPIRAYHKKRSSRGLQKSISLDCNTNVSIDTRASVGVASHQQAQSFDYSPSKQSMYLSPARSLPLPSPFKMFKSRSRSLQKKLSLDAYSFDRSMSNDIGITDKKLANDETDMSSQGGTKGTIPFDYISERMNNIDHTSFVASPLGLIGASIDEETASGTRSAIAACSPCSVKTEAATPRHEMLDNNEYLMSTYLGDSSFIESDGTESLSDLRLLSAVRRRSTDSSMQSSQGTKSFEKDQVLADFVEEAIGDGICSVQSVLSEMHAKNINTIEDLLNLSPNEFLSVFSNKELAIEMRDLLHQPEFSAPALDSIYEDACGSGSGGSSSENV